MKRYRKQHQNFKKKPIQTYFLIAFEYILYFENYLAAQNFFAL